MRYYLASYPRSGNTMVRLILQRHFDIAAPSVYETEAMWAAWLDQILPRRAYHPSAEDMECAFWKTHELPAPSEHPKGILIVRDGRDAVVSYAHYLKDFSPQHVPEKFEEVLSHLCLGRWRDMLPSWTEFHQYWLLQDVAVLWYEELRVSEEAAVAAIEKALERVLQRPVRRQQQVPTQSFEKLHNVNPKFFRRGIEGSWRDEMTYAQEATFWRTHGEMMETLGYVR